MERIHASPVSVYGCPSNAASSFSQLSTETNPPKDDEADSFGVVTDKPRHRRFATFASRLISFEHWPTSKQQTKEDLSTAGFVYCGKEDIVQCFFCGISLKEWPLHASPWEQHIIASSKCGHVRLCKGTNYIKSVLAQQEDGNAVDDSCDVVDIVQIAMQRNPIAIEAAREFCTNEDEIRRAVKLLVKNDPNTTFSAVNLVRLTQEEDVPVGSSDSIANNGERNEADEKDKFDIVMEQTEHDASEDIDTDCDYSDSEDDVEETNRQLNESVNCKICYNALSCVITLPCGHMVCCSQCVSAFTKCVMCRAEIKGAVRALMAV